LKRLSEEVIPFSGIRGIVMYGSGRHFSSGADLDDLLTAVTAMPGGGPASSSSQDLLNNNLHAFRFFEQCTVPVVAAIRGVCLGSALELALFCHARVCGAGAVLGLPESTFGLMPGCGGIYKMHSLTGRARTMELVLTGASFSAEEALAWKIVDLIVPKKEVIARAIELINKLADRPRHGCTSPIVENAPS
jgi:enoyl-CoA hydratase